MWRLWWARVISNQGRVIPPNSKRIMRYTLSCGHSTDDIVDAFDLQVKSTDHNGDRQVEYLMVCQSCMTKYQDSGLILGTRDEVNDWLNSKSISVLARGLLHHPDDDVQELCKLLLNDRSFSVILRNSGRITTVFCGSVITGTGKVFITGQNMLVRELYRATIRHIKEHGVDDFSTMLNATARRVESDESFTSIQAECDLGSIQIELS